MDAKAAHPNSSFWIKADATDVVSGIQESLKHEWNGDVDMNDGVVQSLREEYLATIEKASQFGLPSRSKAIKEDALFIRGSLNNYIGKIEEGTASASSHLLTL